METKQIRTKDRIKKLGAALKQLQTENSDLRKAMECMREDISELQATQVKIEQGDDDDFVVNDADEESSDSYDESDNTASEESDSSCCKKKRKCSSE